MITTRRNILKLLGLTIAGQSLPFNIYSSSAKANIIGDAYKPFNIKSAFEPKTAEWNIEWPGKVSQHDLVYHSPPIDPLQGIPLGNGDVGALFWCEESKIIAVVNKCDLWDDASFERFHNWKKEEEDYNTTLRHACRIIIDLKYPIFSTLYLSDFNARLNLKDASLTMDVKSPFGTLSLDAFVDHSTGNILYDLRSDFKERIPLDISVERFGSRTFSHWYSLINRDASIGISGAEAIVDDNGSYITQKLSGTNFSVGGTVIQDNNLNVSYKREHSHRAFINLTGNKYKKIQIAFSVTSPSKENSLLELKESLSSIERKGMASLRKSNEDIWKSIWNRSFMDYGDDYLNNLWYLTMYYANASQGGKYPGRFNNGLWTWSRDVQNWNFYFHWNQQQLYWPLNAAGHHDLIEPYLDFRFKSLSQAKNDAKEFFNSDGAFIADVTDRRGYNSLNEKHNHTPVAEIALDFWRQYQYTGDKKFLKEKALPFIIEATKFFESLFEKEADGLYHAKEGTGYEGWIRLKDGLTEIVYANVLFSTAIEATKEVKTNIPEIKKWKEILKNLAPLPLINAEEKSIASHSSQYKLQRGQFKGRIVKTNKILAAGWGIKEKRWLTVYNPADDGKYSGFNLLDGIFPTVSSSPVFPSGHIGLSQKEKNDKLFESITANILLYPSGVTGWDPVPIAKARLGLADELALELKKFPERWQIYCNGWGHWGLEGEIKKDAEWFFRTNKVKDASSPSKEFLIPMWPFRHMSMESMSVLTTAMNESLLQSYDGVLRIAPAFSNTSSGRFTLHAVGGFIVSAEINAGIVQWICIKSKSGNNCRVSIPWEETTLNSNMQKERVLIKKGITEIKTLASEIIIMVPEGVKMSSWSHLQERPKANNNVKYHSSGNAQLGIPRMF